MERHSNQMNCDSRDELLYRIHLRKFNRRAPVSGPRVFRLILKYSKYCRVFSRYCSLIMGAYVANIDLCACASEDDNQGERKQTTPARRPAGWLKPFERSNWRRRLKLSWIPWTLLVTYLLVAAILSVDSVFLYRHEINRMRLERVRELIRVHGRARAIAIGRDPVGLNSMTGMGTGAGGGSSELVLSLGEFEQILVARVEEARLVLVNRGGKFIAWGLGSACYYITTIIMGSILYLIAMWVYMFGQLHDNQFQRDCFERATEELRVDARCEKTVDKFLQSQRVYSSISTAYNHRNLPPLHFQAPLALKPTTRKQSNTDSMGRPVDTARLLAQMLQSGALRPPHRCHLWMQRRDAIYMLLYANAIVWCILFIAGVDYALYSRSAGGFDLCEPCLWFMQFTNCCALTYHMAAIVGACLTQRALVCHVLAVVRECIRANERELVQYIKATGNAAVQQRQSRSQTESQRAALVERVNSNYLFALMTYKLFAAQYGAFKRTNRGFLPAAFLLASVIAAIARVHTPYLEHEVYFRPLVLGISFSMLLPFDSVCVPMCNLYARCQQLLPALSSLIAHVARVRAGTHGRGTRTIYDEHAVVVLAKELSNPKRLLEQFEVKSLGLSGTYADLTRLHFWWGLIVLSILLNFNSDNQNQLFGSYSIDPLGVWCFRLI